MGKKMSNLSPEESEQRKKENLDEWAKMTSALSGIPMSKLLKKKKLENNYSEKDCESKRIILQSLYEPCTGRELWERSKQMDYDAKYKTFTSLLVRYQKYGYIEKQNDEKPYVYGLTGEGKVHAKNPKLAREENIRRFNGFWNDKLREIIMEDPEKFREIYESIFGEGSFGNLTNFVASGGNYGGYIGNHQSNNNDFGGYTEEKETELNTKIFDKDFWKNADFDKICDLVKTATFGKLSDEENEMLTSAMMEAVNSHKGSMTIKEQQYNPSKPVGTRNYYEILVKGIDQKVTKSVYEAIPFRFIYVTLKNELRLEFTRDAGKYKNNKDAVEADFDFVNKNYFYNNMLIKTKNNPQKKELTFYYVGYGKNGNVFSLEITTMSHNDYEKSKSTS